MTIQNRLPGGGYGLGAVLAVAALVVLRLAPPDAMAGILDNRMLGIHLVLELFAVVIAMLVVMVCWHTFDATQDRASNVLISGFIVVAVCDLVHALSYAGMPLLIAPGTTERAIFFWLAGRTFEVGTFGLVALTRAPSMTRLKSIPVGLAISAMVVWLGIAHLDYFPQTFIEGTGVTRFKARYEYVLFALDIAVAVLLWHRSRRRSQEQYKLLALSSFLMGIGELAFTSYVASSDFQNIVGHVFKVVAYALLYRATFIVSIRAPFDALSRSEALVRESDARLRSLSDNLPHCMVYQFAVDADGSKRFLYVSQGVERLHGVAVEDVLRDFRTITSQVHPKDGSLLLAAEARSLLSLQEYQVTVRMRRADGAHRRVQFTSIPRRVSENRMVWDGIELDVTDAFEAEQSRRLLEAQLRESQKMESIGSLSSGIAHDFNNILGSILGNASMALEDIETRDYESLRDGILQIRKAANRARDLVGQILTFGRRQPLVRTVQPLVPIVEEVVGLLRATLPRNVSLEERFESRRVQVLADTTQIEQVVLNLCTNAWQAMGEERGQIEVSVSVVEVGAGPAALADIAPGSYARLRVRDDGHGMDKDTCARVFEPFFTTKPVGLGTGLGLAVTHGIVRTHQGSIQVESRLRHGTTFDVYLPVAADSGAPDDPHIAVSPPFEFSERGAGQQILYVDDDEVMSVMVERLLTRTGYQVTCHSDPTKALEEFRNQPSRFALTVTDFNMPLHSGLDVIRMLRAIRPELPVVLISGSVTQSLRTKASDLNVTLVLDKQNTLEQLPGAIALALNGAV